MRFFDTYRMIIPSKYRMLFHWDVIYRKIKEYYSIKIISKRQLYALKKIEGKKTIKCVFFALYDSVWKYDKVYQLMAESSRFDPLILVCPVVKYGREDMLNKMEECYSFFYRKGYKVIKSYNDRTDTYINVPIDINPDVILYTNPYDGLIDSRYFISNFKDILTIYVPYSLNNSCAFDANYNMILHNLLWRYYLPTQYHLNYSIQYARNKGVNSVISGYPGIEPLIDNHIPSEHDWKVKLNTQVKRIIWAPHHTIEPAGVVYYSCFIRYCDFMIEMAIKYKDKVQFVFKPHPFLRNKLYAKWGYKRTDDYYLKWTQLPNTNINEGDYEDLFITSDAMIHDSGSFIGEYLYVNKPVMRTLNEVEESEKMNDFAMECLSNHYFARNEEDIEHFIQNVINGIDPLKEQRTKFVQEKLIPKGSPSQNIINDILDSIDNQILYRN